MREVRGGNTERINIVCEAATIVGVVLGLWMEEGSFLRGKEEKLLSLTWGLRKYGDCQVVFMCSQILQ